MVSKTKAQTASQRHSKSKFWFSIAKGTIYAITLSLILILLFAVLISLFDIPYSFITPTNQVIKIISLFIGCYIALRGCSNGFIKGMIVGGIYNILSYTIFSLLCGVFTFGIVSVTDLVFSVLIGGLCGIIAANFKR